MHALIVVLIGLHVVTGVFWAGTTFALARSAIAGTQSIYRAQMGAATLAVLAGVTLWGLLHGGPPGPTERTLAIGALCAIAAAGVQGALRKKNPLKAQRIAAGLLVITVICMAIARYV
jgi:hypothetical protein